MVIPIPVIPIALLVILLVMRLVKAASNAKPINQATFTPELTTITRSYTPAPADPGAFLTMAAADVNGTQVEQQSNIVLVRVPAHYLAVRLTAGASDGKLVVTTEGRRTTSQKSLAEADSALRSFEGALRSSLIGHGLAPAT